MTRRDEIAEQYPELLVMDPDYFDEAIIGVVTRIGLEAVCYDTHKVIEILMSHDGMTEEDAIEHMDFNMKGGWVGEYTPVFLE
jgi:hypothetical protein